MKLAALILLSLFSPASRADFTYADLVALIKAKNIRSVEELTAALPRELQNHVTFRLKPHNRLQEGTRAIRFTPNGRLVLTHTHDPSARGGLSVEALEVASSGEIRLHDISFSEDKRAPTISSDSKNEKAHLQSCFACHGEAPRMIWPAYNEWPDTCGAADDNAEEACVQFLKEAKKNPRFKDLKWDPKNPAWPYYSGGSVATNQKNRVLRNMPNTRFTALVTYHNSRQAANVVQKSALYPHLKFNLIRQNRCQHLPAPAAIIKRLKEALARDSAILPPASWSGTREAYVEEIFADREISEYARADISSVKLFYDKQNRLTFLEFFGIPRGNTGGTEVLTKAGRTGSGFTGQEFGGDTTSLMTVQLINDLARTDRKLRRFAKAREIKLADALTPSPYFDPRVFVAGLDPAFNKEYEGRLQKSVNSDTDLCGYLMERSEAELIAYERLLNTWPKGRERPVANVPSAEELRELREIRAALKADKLKAGEALLKHEKCIACHDPTSGPVVGPHFPFRDARRFAIENQDTKKYSGTLVQRIKEAISSDTALDLRMPLNRPALSAEEREAIVLYLEALASYPAASRGKPPSF